MLCGISYRVLQGLHVLLVSWQCKNVQFVFSFVCACGVVLFLTSLLSFVGAISIWDGTCLYWQLSVWWCLVVCVDTCMVFSRHIIVPPPSLRYLSQVHHLPMSFKKRDCENESMWPMIFPHNSVTCIDLGGKYYHELLIFAIFSFCIQPTYLVESLNLSIFLYVDIWMVFLYLKLEVMVLFTVTDFIRWVEQVW